MWLVLIFFAAWFHPRAVVEPFFFLRFSIFPFIVQERTTTLSNILFLSHSLFLFFASYCKEESSSRPFPRDSFFPRDFSNVTFKKSVKSRRHPRLKKLIRYLARAVCLPSRTKSLRDWSRDNASRDGEESERVKRDLATKSVIEKGEWEKFKPPY